ncbi:hypothetical protein VB773_21040 [Haloarculaceae archaeon H-GB2-1]|nr:hypothetical protein [Haloarculaceae archaeon H-GB1-1]MEA5389393.1 hypothetical protein [Haloarculaceae archaeon H-GB11]MEA5409808.1 hypothetical protein [Haloarculaceae archaeon H-GB2-1]
MTGMKEGAGEDPFADDSNPSSSGTSTGTADASPSSEPETESEPVDTSPKEDSGRPSAVQIPYKFRRDGVQDGRDRVPLFLKAETKRGERDALRELEDRFGDDVSLTDLREALMKTGLEHLDEVEEHLEAWGYGMSFDE